MKFALQNLRKSVANCKVEPVIRTLMYDIYEAKCVYIQGRVK